MAHEPRDPHSGPRSHDSANDPDTRRRTAFLEQELELLQAKVAESPRHMRLLEDRLAEAQTRVAALNDRNDRLAETLREARDQMVSLKEEIDRLAQPPEWLRRVPRGLRGRHCRHLHLRPQSCASRSRPRSLPNS